MEKLCVYSDASIMKDGVAIIGFSCYEDNMEMVLSDSKVFAKDAAVNDINYYEIYAFKLALSELNRRNMLSFSVVFNLDNFNAYKLIKEKLNGRCVSIGNETEAPLYYALLDEIVPLWSCFKDANIKWIPRRENKADSICSKIRRDRSFDKMLKRMKVRHIYGDVYSVKSKSSGDVFYDVDLSARTCECTRFSEHGEVCSHIRAAEMLAEKRKSKAAPEDELGPVANE